MADKSDKFAHPLLARRVEVGIVLEARTSQTQRRPSDKDFELILILEQVDSRMSEAKIFKIRCCFSVISFIIVGL